MLVVFCLSQPVGAEEVPFTLEDRDRLIRIETTLKEFKESVDQRFEGVDQRFETFQNNINGRFDDLHSFLTILTGPPLS